MNWMNADEEDLICQPARPDSCDGIDLHLKPEAPALPIPSIRGLNSFLTSRGDTNCGAGRDGLNDQLRSAAKRS